MKTISIALILLIATRASAQFQDTAAFRKNLNNELTQQALTKTSANGFAKTAAIAVPVLMTTYGFYALESHQLQQINLDTKEEIGEHHPYFATSADNYMQFTPAIAVYGLNAMNIKGKNNLRDATMIYLLSTAFMSTTVYTVKNLTHEERPDLSNFHSFPSGHTATAFAAAEFLRQEYKDQSPWYGVAGYTVAFATGGLRMYNNKHWLSDVVAGAGVGILSTKLAYWVYPSIKKKLFKDKPMNTLIVPTYQQNTFGFSAMVNLK